MSMDSQSERDYERGKKQVRIGKIIVVLGSIIGVVNLAYNGLYIANIRIPCFIGVIGFLTYFGGKWNVRKGLNERCFDEEIDLFQKRS